MMSVFVFVLIYIYLKGRYSIYFFLYEIFSNTFFCMAVNLNVLSSLKCWQSILLIQFCYIIVTFFWPNKPQISPISNTLMDFFNFSIFVIFFIFLIFAFLNNKKFQITFFKNFCNCKKFCIFFNFKILFF